MVRVAAGSDDQRPALIDVFGIMSRAEFLRELHAHADAMNNRFTDIEHTLTNMEVRMATQAQVDALRVQLTAASDAQSAATATLIADDVSIAAALKALATANPALDLTALTAAVQTSTDAAAAAQAAVDATTALIPPVVTPPPVV